MKKIKFCKSCGRCEKKLNYNESFYCKECEKFKFEIKTFCCRVCNKKHERTESLDCNYKGLCRECFYEDFEKWKPPQRILDDLKKMEISYKKKYG